MKSFSEKEHKTYHRNPLWQGLFWLRFVFSIGNLQLFSCYLTMRCPGVSSQNGLVEFYPAKTHFLAA